jgi:hypothetical protein
MQQEAREQSRQAQCKNSVSHAGKDIPRNNRRLVSPRYVPVSKGF